ncbi:hypothetical protein [uncultured Tateyamaria sp.]|uniref:hypothetical protein n=1 Tax=uncultured Tateyamaria sp. TaxID=455651 RepID=UPI00262F9223|nr:hypothetical protein [uncultured Tateyamaria sp.]
MTAPMTPWGIIQRAGQGQRSGKVVHVYSTLEHIPPHGLFQRGAGGADIFLQRCFQLIKRCGARGVEPPLGLRTCCPNGGRHTKQIAFDDAGKPDLPGQIRVTLDFDLLAVALTISLAL